MLATFVLLTESVERPNAVLWEIRLRQISMKSSALRAVLRGMEEWITDKQPFSIVLSDGEVRLRVILATTSERLVLGPEKAGMHFVWDGIGVQCSDVAFVVDESCIRASLSSLQALVES